MSEKYSANSSENDYFDWKCKIINNKYIIVKNINKGGYASVWLSYSLFDKIYYAIKIHNSDDFNHGKKEAFIYDELNKFNIPNIMKLHESFHYIIDDNNYFLCVMDLMQCSLLDFAKEYIITDEILNKITKDLLLTLEKMHINNFIHADIKPDNILVSGTNQTMLKFIEFIDIQNLIKLCETNKKLKKKSEKNISINYDILLQKIKDKMEEYNNVLNSDFNYESNSESGSRSSYDSGSRSSYESKSDSESESNYKIINYFTSDTENKKLSLLDFTTSSVNNSFYKSEKKTIDINNFNIKLSDMGTCVHLNIINKKKFIQTCYYRSPEILLENNYSFNCDIWALGCSLYEIITDDILFDAYYDDDQNNTKYHLYLITQTLGDIPIEMKEKSPKKNIYFTNNFETIRGFNNYTLNKSKILNLLDKNIAKIILKMLNIDPEKRLSASDLLNYIQ
jgi:serine/threonine-protein kinase SRPK3